MKEKKYPDKDIVSVYAQYDMNVPAHKKAMENLEEYQRQTGLSLKQALVFILLAFNPEHPQDTSGQTGTGRVPEGKGTGQEIRKFSEMESMEGFPDAGIY